MDTATIFLIDLVYHIACHTYLTTLIRLAMLYYKSKPPLMTGVVDLVACDQILSYYFSVISLNILSLPRFLGLAAVPDLAYSFINWNAAFWSYVFCIYLSVVVVLQYAQILKKTTTLFDMLRDESVQFIIRLLVVTLASAITALRYSFLCHSKNIYSSKQDSVVPSCFTDHYLSMGLLLTSLVVNAVLRILILLRSHRHSKSEERKADLWGLFCMTVCVVVLFKSFLWFMRSLETTEVNTKLLGPSIVSRTKRGLIGLFICWIIPTFIVVLHGSMRKFILKKVMKAISGMSANLVYVVRYVYATIYGVDVMKASSTVHPKD